MDDSLWRHLPSEIIEHILSLLPVKSLCRFKCVSPKWKSLISSPEFSKTYLHINKPQKTILIDRSCNALYAVDLACANPTAEKLCSFSAEQFGAWRGRVSPPCNGLVFVQGESYESSLLLNPFTSEFKRLPKPPFSDIDLDEGLERSVCGLGYDLYTDDYKVVIATPYFGGAVYSLRTDAWSRIQTSHGIFLENQFGVYLNDRLHWVCVHRGFHAADFDFSDDGIFKKFQLPDYVVNNTHMVVLRGCLCLYTDNRHVIHFWVMKEYGVTDSWTKISISDPRALIESVLCLSAEDEFVLSMFGKMADVNGEIIDESSTDPDRNHLVLYNPKTETVRAMVVPGIPTLFLYVGISFETLISPYHG